MSLSLFAIFSFLVYTGQSLRSAPICRLRPIDPRFAVGDNITLGCVVQVSGSLNASDLRLKLDNSDDSTLLSILANSTNVYNHSTLVFNTVASMLWNDIRVNCYGNGGCLDQVKITVCYAPTIPVIMEYKIYDWKDLMFRWKTAQDSLTESAYYRILSGGSDEDKNFSTCEGAGPLEGADVAGSSECKVKDFYSNLVSTAVQVQLRVEFREGCTGRVAQNTTGVLYLESIVQTKPVRGLECRTIHGDATTPGRVTVRVTVDDAGRNLTVELRFSCPGFQEEVKLAVQTVAEFVVTGLPLDESCVVVARSRSLGPWSEGRTAEFRSPKEVPLRNPKLKAFHVSGCKGGGGQKLVALFFENLPRNESRGDPTWYDVRFRSDTVDCFDPFGGAFALQCPSGVGCLPVRGERPPESPSSSSSSAVLLLRTNSTRINGSVSVANEAGACPFQDDFLVDTETKESVKNFTSVRTADGTVRLSWGLVAEEEEADDKEPKSLVVLWCRGDPDCKTPTWREISSALTTFDIESSGGPVSVVGFGPRFDESRVPRIVLSRDICFLGAAPLPPVIQVKQLDSSRAVVGLFQPACSNGSGLPYETRVEVVRMEGDNESTVEGQVLPAGQDAFELLKPGGGNFQVSAFARSQGGLSPASNRLSLLIGAERGESPRSEMSYLAILAILVLVLVSSVFFCFYRFRKKKTDRLKITVPQGGIHGEISSNGYAFFRATSESSDDQRGSEADDSFRETPNSSSSCPLERENSTACDSTKSSVYQLAKVPSEPRNLDDDSHYKRGYIESNNHYDSNNNRDDDDDSGSSSVNFYRECGEISPVSCFTPIEEGASPGKPGEIFFTDSSSGLKLPDYSKVSVG